MVSAAVQVCPDGPLEIVDGLAHLFVGLRPAEGAALVLDVGSSDEIAM